MKIWDEMIYSKVEEEEELISEKEQQLQHRCCSGMVGLLNHRRLIVVGYALTSKKAKSFLQPKLEGLARNKGIMFLAIDHNRPLADQGPFDIVLHKLSGKDWRQILESASLTFIMNHESVIEVEA